MKLLKLVGIFTAAALGLLANAQIGAAAPTPGTAPVVSGTATIGQVLTTTDGEWTGEAVDSYSYKWFRCATGDPSPTSCTEITGANSTNSTYTLKSSATVANSDTGKFIRSQVTATNGSGSASAFSNTVGPVNSGTVPASSLSLTARSGSLFTNAFKSAEWRVETGASAPPTVSELLPTRETTLRLPGPSQMTFNPGNMPVCPDNQIGPDTNNSVEIPVITARCPNSIIGNGTATFLLNRVNNPNSSPPSLDAQVIAFNGGLVGGQPRVKFWAYSYDTGVAIYTESVLSTSGVLSIPIPQLTSDSAVNTLNVNIPGETITQYLPGVDKTVTIPGGQKADYVQAKCDTGTFPFSSDFLLGRRLTDGTPIGEGELYTNVGSNASCTGVPATAKLGKVTVTGPSKAKRGKVATYSVKITNTGALNASGVQLAIAGRGVKINTSVGTIAGAGSRTVKVKVKFRNKGRIKASFKASSSNAGSASATKTVTVK